MSRTATVREPEHWSHLRAGEPSSVAPRPHPAAPGAAAPLPASARSLLEGHGDDAEAERGAFRSSGISGPLSLVLRQEQPSFALDRAGPGRGAAALRAAG